MEKNRRKKIVLGVTGGIAAYKSVYLLRMLVREGYDVRVVGTENSKHFVGEATWRTLSGNRPAFSMWDGAVPSEVPHIEPSQKSDLFIVAPATANIIAKMNNGICDDLLSSMLVAADIPILIVPSMNSAMYENPATQKNLRELEKRDNIKIMEPSIGELACGYSGKGKMPEPEIVFGKALSMLYPKADSSLKWVVTGGATKEYLDPIRYITNDASGKTAYAVAQEAFFLGHEVVFVQGRGDCFSDAPFPVEKAETAEEMNRVVQKHISDSDIFIMSAAVADYTSEKSDRKIKKKNGDLILKLHRTKDILKETVSVMKPLSVRVGFAAETENLLLSSEKKMEGKKLDIVVANTVDRDNNPFGSEKNSVTIFFGEGRESFRDISKKEIAKKIVNSALECYNQKSHEKGGQSK